MQQTTRTDSEIPAFVSNIARIKGQAVYLANQDAAQEYDSASELSIIIFEIGKSLFALPTMTVTEVVRAGSIVPIPRAPAFIEGIIEIREQVIPVVDLRKKLGFAGAKSAGSVIIVAVVGGMKTGFIVDSARKVLALNADEMQDLGSIVSGPEARYIYRTVNRNNQPIVILNVNSILNEEEISSLAGVREK